MMIPNMDNFLYLLSQPVMLIPMTIIGILLFALIFGSRIYTWYQYKYRDFGTCRRCGGKQDNEWYLCCMKCYEQQSTGSV